jgi:hypothetical protein
MSDATRTPTELHPLELHYFRIARENWELMLARLRQMGADAVSTMAPWSWHEPYNGIFDATGITHAERSLTDLVEVCRAMGLPMVLRVGPYLGAGLLGGGVPGWLLQEHPEICALGPDSQPRRDPASSARLPSAEHPTYLKYVERWFRALTNVLLAWQAPEGPIVALQVHHLGPQPTQPATDHIPTDWDYNPHVVKVQWPVWLRQQYVGIEDLNAAWQADYRSFSDAAFPVVLPTPDTPARYLEDAQRFVAYAAGHALETYARLLREMGWTIPIDTDPNAFPTAPAHVTHVAQVDPEPPQIGAGLRWAMDAPLRPAGHPRRLFWDVKAALLGMEQGVRRAEGAVLVASPESRRIRLPRPATGYVVYRLLLDGQPVKDSARARGDALYLDYTAWDDMGQTDMYLILDTVSVPLTDFLRAYFVCLLMGRASALARGGRLCQTLAEALSSNEPMDSPEKASVPSEDLQVAQQRLAEAHRAARRAAASLGRLERLADEIRGGIPAATSPILSNSLVLSPTELERLSSVRDACAQVAPALLEAADLIKAVCQPGASHADSLTIDGYQAAYGQGRATAAEAYNQLARALSFLRAELACGTLPAPAWIVQGWLTRILQGISVGWID